METFVHDTDTNAREDFNWNAFEFFTIGVSVRLSRRSLHREEQKKLLPVGIEIRTSGSSGQCLTKLGRNLLGRRFLK